VRRYLDRDRDDQHGRTSMPEGYRANVVFGASTASRHRTQERP
jgi:hypothetical protein